MVENTQKAPGCLLLMKVNYFNIQRFLHETKMIKICS